MLAAPRGLEDRDVEQAARTAIAYVQLADGRQLQQRSDEARQADPLDVASMSREGRGAPGDLDPTIGLPLGYPSLSLSTSSTASSAFNARPESSALANFLLPRVLSAAESAPARRFA